MRAAGQGTAARPGAYRTTSGRTQTIADRSNELGNDRHGPKGAQPGQQQLSGAARARADETRDKRAIKAPAPAKARHNAGVPTPATGSKSGKSGKGRLAGAHRHDAPRGQPAPRAPRGSTTSAAALHEPGADARYPIAATVEGLGYELVDVERAPRGLLRVTIDRIAGRTYAEPGDAVTVDDCEQVSRQLQYALEVDGVDYARLEVSSPGLDRPLRHAADYARFVGARVRLTLREPLAGRRNFEGELGAGAPGQWQLTFVDGKSEQVLGFTLDEVREAQLVPVLDFKGRRAAGAARAAATPPAQAREMPQAEDDQEVSR